MTDVYSMVRSMQNVHFKSLAIIDNANHEQWHREWIEDLHRAFVNGEIIVDLDDPRTTEGLTAAEVAYIRGEACLACHHTKCDCDEQYEAWRADIQAREDGDEPRDY